MSTTEHQNYRQLGAEKAQQGEFEEALQLFNEALIENPKDAEIYEMMAQCHTEIEEFQEALDYAKKAVELSPDWVTGHLTLGRCYRNSTHFRKALQVLNSALRMDEKNIEIQEELEEVQDLWLHAIRHTIGLLSLEIQQSHQEKQGPGSIVWDCGIVLAHYLVYTFNQGRDQSNIIELGAGTGIVGISAACLGANVVLTDISDQQKKIAQNIQLNQKNLVGKCEFGVLQWDLANQQIEKLPVIFERCDIVCGADLIYNKRSISPLIQTYLLFMKKYPEAQFIMCHKHRSDRLDFEIQEQFNNAGVSFVKIDDVYINFQTNKGIKEYGCQISRNICVYEMVKNQQQGENVFRSSCLC